METDDAKKIARQFDQLGWPIFAESMSSDGFGPAPVLIVDTPDEDRLIGRVARDFLSALIPHLTRHRDRAAKAVALMDGYADQTIDQGEGFARARIAKGL